MSVESGVFDETAFLNLLNGISQRQFFDDSNITEKSLKTEWFPNLTDDEFNHTYERMCQILKMVATASMDISQLQAFLTSRVRHREPAHRITEEQAKVISKFWKAQKKSIMESLSKRTKFNPTLQHFNWRLEIASPSKALQQANNAIVVFQLNLEDSSLSSKTTSKSVEIELDSRGMAKLFTSMKEIDNQIKNFVQMPLRNI